MLNKLEELKEGKKKQYLAGREFSVRSKEKYLNFIETHITDKETAENFFSHSILSYNENGYLEHIESKNQDGDIRKVPIGENKIEYKNLRINKLYDFQLNENGQNWLGGKAPTNFLIPNNTCPSSFQYLGKLSANNKAFKWLPFDINLICPIFLNFNKIWLDYSEPNAPKILNLEEVNSLSKFYDDIKPNSFIEYEQVKFDTIPVIKTGLEIGFTGIPSWIQFSDIPKCPKTHKTMRFLCQLQDSQIIKTKRTNIEPVDDWYNRYFEKMTFWGDGELFVFFEPESLIACYMIQNS